MPSISTTRGSARSQSRFLILRQQLMPRPAWICGLYGQCPVAAALNLIVEEAVKARASDIHIEPEEKRLRIRYRIDGVLHEVMSLPIKIHPPLTSRVKVMSDLNIADHLRPQDGQFSLEVKGKGIDVRVATSPLFMEKR